MSDDWDVIEELEFWDDYNEFYGPQRPTKRQAKKMTKAKKRQDAENARKQKQMIRDEVSRQLKEQGISSSSVNQGTGTGCATMLFVIVLITILMGLCFCGATYLVQAKNLAPTDSGWELKWSDEFDAKELNEDVWTYDLGTGYYGWGNGELQSYTNRKKNVKLKDGNLVIHAMREHYGSSAFTSGRIKTMNKKAFKYGKIEAKIKVERGNQSAVWPAFWMMGDNGLPWPHCGELDIMEHANDRPYASGAIHWMAGSNSMMWSGMFNGHVYKYPGGKSQGINAWHTYGIVWGANHIDWYVDNKVYFSVDIRDSNAGAFRKKQYFLLNCAISSKNTGYTGFTGPKKSFKEATMYVDYVRVYENKDKSYTKPYPERIDVSDELDTFATQINEKSNAVKLRSFVNQKVKGETISSYGMIFGLKSYDGTDDTGLKGDDLTVESKNKLVKVFQNDSEDLENLELQESLSATYYNTDLIFDDGLSNHKNAVYYARPYTIIGDGSYVYGETKIVDIKELLKK